LLDFGIKFSDESASLGTWLVPEYTDDGVHFNQLGTLAAKDYEIETINNPNSSLPSVIYA